MRQESGHTLCFVPASTIVLPPEDNVEVFDWSPGESEEASSPLEEMTEADLRFRRQQLEALMGMGDSTSS